MATSKGGQPPASPPHTGYPATLIELVSQVVKTRQQTKRMIAIVCCSVLAISAGISIILAALILAAKGLNPAGLDPGWLSFAVPAGLGGLSLVTFATILTKKIIKKIIKRLVRVPIDERRTSERTLPENRALGQRPPRLRRLQHTRPLSEPSRPQLG